MSIANNVMAKVERKKAATKALAANWARTLEGEAKQRAPWSDKFGHARQTIHGGVETNGDEIEIYLSHGKEYGKYLEEGTEPHDITPKNKSFLQFKVGGKTIRTKKVKHPGTKAYPIIGPTIDKNWSEIKKTIKDLWS